jgi:hypothetical protein
MKLKALLLLENAPGHEPELAFPLVAEFSFISLLKPNTIFSIQSMDQQIIVYFKRIYTKKFFHKGHELISGEDGTTLKKLWNYNSAIFKL